MWKLWWYLLGERRLHDACDLELEDVYRERGNPVRYIVTRITPAGERWGRKDRWTESASAMLEVAIDEVDSIRRFTRNDETRIITILMKRFGVDEQAAASAVYTALQRSNKQGR